MSDDLIGPHEGKEFALLDKGQKHVAFFHDVIPDAYYEYRDRDEYDVIEFSKSAKTGNREIIVPYVILFRKTHRDDAEKFASIVQQGYQDFFKLGAAIVREQGRILSYPEPAVEYYISRLRGRGKIA